MIRLEGVSKKFGRRVAVEPLDLTVPEGSVYGLLGHNGAGKSTTLGMILGQVYPTRGRVHVNGHDVFTHRRQALREVGAIFEAPAFYEYLSGRANLKIMCQYSGPVDRRRMDEVIELAGLTGRIGDKVVTYSHGMRQRLGLAQALLPGPRLLILDEPADGLDPEGIHEMRQFIRRLHREWGLTILFSSHQLHEVEQVSTHVAVMREGRLLFDGPWPPPPPEEGEGQWIHFTADRQEEAARALFDAGLATHVTVDGRAQIADSLDSAAVNQWLIERGFKVHAISPHRVTLEEFYLQMAAKGGTFTAETAETAEGGSR